MPFFNIFVIFFMRFKINLILKKGTVFPYNYQYQLSSAIYSFIKGSGLHDRGYGRGMKLFAFSPIIFENADYRREGIVTSSQVARWYASFYDEDTALEFFEGLSQSKSLSIGRNTAHIGGIEEFPIHNEGVVDLYAISPIVVTRRVEGVRHQVYLNPYQKEYDLLDNLSNKYMAYHGIRIPPEGSVRLVERASDFQKLITVKGIKVRGYKYRFRIDAHPELVNIGMLAGFGDKNSMGFGFCCEKYEL